MNRLNMVLTKYLKTIYQEKIQSSIINDLKRPIKEVINFLKNDLKSRSIEVIVNFTKKLPNIRGDEDQLKQVFLNLIKNAMQAIGEKGKILIKGSSHGNENYLKVSISDNGCGIDKYEMQNIFKPYFTTKYDGTGLGLIIIEKILKAHNANISIESNKKR